MKRSLLSLFLVLCFLVALLPQAVVTASAVTASGVCGENLTWTFEEETGTLTISGSGDMYDFSYSGENTAPWYAQRSAITRVILGEDVTSVGTYAFLYCRKLTELFLPAKIQKLGEDAILGTSVAAYTVAEENPYFSVDAYGVLFNKDKTVLKDCPDGFVGDYAVPEGVETIEYYAFWYVDGLTKLSIPGTVKTMDHIISNCDALKVVEFGEGITRIGRYTLCYCSSLYRVSLPTSLKTIDDYAFFDLNTLSSLSIPENVEYIGKGAFIGCDYLSRLTVLNPECEFYDDGTQNPIGFQPGSVLSGYANSTTQAYADAHDILFQSIPDAPLSGTCGEALTWSFDYNTGTLTIAGSGDMYDYNTWEGTPTPWYPHRLSIGAVVLTDGVTGIGNHAFQGCYYLSELPISENVGRIGTNALTGLGHLQKYHVAENNSTFLSDEYGVLYSKDRRTLISYPCALDAAYTVPDGVVTILPYAFSNAGKLRTLTLPGTLQTFDSAIQNCDNLHWVNFTYGITRISSYGVAFCPNLATVTLPDTLSVIEGCAFYGNSALTEIEIPEGVTQIGKDAFTNCSALASITVSNPGCHIYDEGLSTTMGVPGTTVVHSYENSTARAYAEKYGYAFASLGAGPILDESIVMGHTLDLNSNIAVNYAIHRELLEDYDSYYLEVTVPFYSGNKLVGRSTTKEYPSERGDYCYFTCYALNAMQMNDIISATLHMEKDGQEYISTQDIYSIATYAYKQLDKANAPTALKTVCANLLRYGGQAQRWKGYRSDAPADCDLTDTHKSYLKDLDSVTFGNTNRIVSDLENPPVSFVGKSLILDYSIIGRFVVDLSNYQGDTENLCLRATYTKSDGIPVICTVNYCRVYDAEKNYYAFDIASLYASELRAELSLSICEKDSGNRVSDILEYSLDTYGNGKTGPLLTLIQAIMAYSDSAKAYFSPKPSV